MEKPRITQSPFFENQYIPKILKHAANVIGYESVEWDESQKCWLGRKAEKGTLVPLSEYDTKIVEAELFKQINSYYDESD